MDAVADALIQAIRSRISDNDAQLSIQPSTQQNEGSQQSSFRRTAAMSNSLTSPQPSTSRGIPFPSRNETSDVGRRKRKFVAPSMFQTKAKRRKVESKPKSVKYLRDIFCLPKSCMDEDGTVAIPRSTRRSILASKEVGLMGKIEFSSDWSPNDMKMEICRVFSKPFGLTEEEIEGGKLFAFEYLQRTGAGSRTLCVPAVPPGYEWNGRQVATLAKSGGVIYLLATDDIPILSEQAVSYQV